MNYMIINRSNPKDLPYSLHPWIYVNSFSIGFCVPYHLVHFAIAAYLG